MHSYRIDLDSHILWESFTGEIDATDLNKANSKILNDPDFRRGLRFVSDMRDATISMGYEEMARHVQQHPDLCIKKQAFIVSSDAALGMTRMFEILSEDKCPNQETNIFKDLETALKWLNS